MKHRKAVETDIGFTVFVERHDIRDRAWRRALAILHTLAIDCRTVFPSVRLSELKPDHFLMRVRKPGWTEKSPEMEPYYRYTLRMDGVASIHGRIMVDDEGALKAFREAVSAALAGDVTLAYAEMRQKAELRSRMEGRNEPVPSSLIEEIRALSRRRQAVLDQGARVFCRAVCR